LEKYKTFTLLLVIGCLVILLWFKNQAIESLQSANTEISYEITKDGKFMATQRQNIMDLEEALKKGLLEKEKYMKNVKSQTKFETKTIITEKFIPYHDTVELYFDTLDKRVWVKTPAPIRFQDSFNLFTGKFTKDGFVLDTMETLNIFRVSIFDKKQGLFKKSIPVVEIKSNNPRTQTTEIQNVTIEKKKPFYSKWWFLTGLGMFVGYFVI
jgi:hypothetical protein